MDSKYEGDEREAMEAERDPTFIRAAKTLAVLAVLALLPGAWIAVPDREEREERTEPAGRGAAAGVAEEAETPGVDPRAPAVWPDSHEVSTGETLSDIAGRYGLEVEVLAAANGLGPTVAIRPGDVLVLPAPDRPRPTAVATATEEAPEVARVLAGVAERFGRRPETVKAIAWAESRWDHGSVSERGAVGIMQVMPDTAELMAEQLGTDLDPYDLEDNVVAGVGYLDWLHDRYGGDERRVLSAYVQGPTLLDDVGPVPAAERYVEAVLEWREEFARAAARD